MANTKYPQTQYFSLYSSGASAGDTEVVLSSFQTIDGTNLAMSDFGDKGFVTLDPGNGTSEEQISFTGVTQNANGTATLTGVSTVLMLSPYTETSGLSKSHSGGSIASVAITSGLLNQFANKGNAETVTGAWVFPNGASTPTLGTSYEAPTIAWQVASKGYVDSVAVAGAPNADTTTKGIVEIATGAELAAGTGTGGTGATVVPAGSSFTNTSAGAGDVNKVPVLDASGQIAVGFIKDASTTVTGKVEIATGAETAAGTATGGTGSSLVPANSSFTATSSGSADANKVPVLTTGGVLADGFAYFTATAGETVATGQGAYAKAADSLAWKSVGTSDEAAFNFIGVFADAGNAGDTVRIVPPGGMLTTSGLTAGAYYFVTDTAGTLGTTPGTRFARVGLALSTTRLLVLVPKYLASGSFTYQFNDASPLPAQTVGFLPGLIHFFATSDGIVASVGTNFGQVTSGGTGVYAHNSSNAWYVKDSGGSTSTGNAGALSSTGFTPTHSSVSNTSQATVRWVAESL